MLQAIAASGEYPYPATKWGGRLDHRLKEGTGFFDKCQENGRWYLCDPEGYAFFSLGPDDVNLRPDDRVDGLEQLMEWLPGPKDPATEDMVIRKQPVGEVERGKPHLFSFRRANLRRVFGENWQRQWADMVVRQLKGSGMNTIANWSDPIVYGKMPYVWMLPEYPGTDRMIFRDFPDVYAPQFEKNAILMAEALRAYRDDPMLIGYFMRNEPGWAFVDGLIIADEVLRSDFHSCTKGALINWLRQKYGIIAHMNAAWQTNFADFDDLLTPMEKASSYSEQARVDLTDFSRLMLDRYIGVVSRACKAVDPNHLNLGMRWAWISDPLVITGWQYFDVFSINCYAVDPTAMLRQVEGLGVDLPVMIGEFHFGALDAGLPATGL